MDRGGRALGGALLDGLVRGLSACALVTVGITVLLLADRPDPEVDTRPVAPRAATLMERYRCSAHGFAPGREIHGAIVRRGTSYSHVGFREGWAAETGGHGDLVAVCLRAPSEEG